VSELAAAILSVSLASAVLQLWLGLTVLLNADRRTWGMWLAAAALILGGLFFLAQGSEAGYGWVSVVFAVHFQWPLGWFIGLSLPLAWYVVMLWHAGFWEAPDAPVRRAHRVWLWIVLVLGVIVFWRAAMAYRYPAAWTGHEYVNTGPLPFGSVPVLTLMYGVFIVLCIVLSMHALSRPGVSSRVMGDLAYRRSRPWLLGTSVGLLLASLVLGGIMLVLASGPPRQAERGIPLLAVWGVLIVSSLILVSVLLLGQAVVAYEIFAGKTLPRGGLRQHWLWTVALALGYGIIVGRTVAMGELSGMGLPMVTLLLAVLFALFNWRSYRERDRYTDQLRPFVTGPRVYDSLLHEGAAEVDAAAPFSGLCEKVLDAECAYLVPLGPLSSLAAPPLTHPAGAPPPDVSDLAARCTSPGDAILPVEPDRYGRAAWAVPLWSERGLIGVLLLGQKSGGGLYTQEEIEIARASAERLIDTVACARMAQRLIALQRQWLSETHLGGRQTRRVIHDDVLPRLHALMLQFSASRDTQVHQAVRELADTHRQLANLLHEMAASGASDIATLGLIEALRRSADDEFAASFDGLTWDIDPIAEQKARDLSPGSAEVLFHATREAVRNAARHGRGGVANRPLHMAIAVAWRGGLEITVEDDGVGPPVGSQTDAGHGVAIHSTLMAVIGGAWATEGSPGKGTRVILALPQSPRDEA
jgi:two-component sensor histidine kinase